MKATKFVRLMLDRDHKRYGSMITEFDKRNHSVHESIVEMTTKLVLELSSPFLKINQDEESLDALIEYYHFVEDHLHYTSLELLFKGSTINCQKVQLNQLVELADHAIKPRFRIYSIRCQN